MNIEDYSKQALTTLTNHHQYGEVSAELMSQVLGLVGESGEIAEKFKKILRDKSGVVSDEDKQELAKELGDILWYVNSVAHLLGVSLDDVAAANLTKLQSRKDRNVLGGSGDNR